jgi:hypothetical protein
MWIQRIIWFLGRMIFYMLLIPLLLGVVYALSHDQWLAALVMMVLSLAVLYKGLIRITVPANSVAVRDGKVAFFMPEKSVRDRFDFTSRGQSIVQLPHFGFLDRPYKLELFSADTCGRVYSCRLSLNLGYIMELPGWQRAYDNYVLYQDKLSLAVKSQLYKISAHLTGPFPEQEEDGREEFLKPVVAQLNSGLEEFGLKVEEALCTFAAGPTLARFVAPEQEIVEKAMHPGEPSREGSGRR